MKARTSSCVRCGANAPALAPGQTTFVCPYCKGQNVVEPPGPIALVPGPPGDAAPVRSRAVVAVVAVAMIGIVVLFLAGLGFFLSVAQDTWTVGGWR